MWSVRRLLGFGVIGGSAIFTAASFRANDGDLDSVGIVRLGRATSTVFSIGLMYKSRLKNHGLDKESQEYKDLKSQVHQMGADKLLQLCCLNKGVYIKVGQHIGALDYLLPKEYVNTMKVLHSHAPKHSITDVYKVLKEEFKKDPSEIFSSFDEEPLGTASLAQVHKATLHDGTTVAVKVQHRYVRGNSLVDMKTMELLVKIVSLVFPDFKFQWLVDETKKNIPKELDFNAEGKNAEKISEMFKDKTWLKIPKIHWDLTTPRVLTMDFVEGGQVNDLEYIQQNKMNPLEITNKLGRLYSEMIFINGFVHSDPHPGNILVQKHGKHVNLVLLDHGLYAELSNDFRYEYSQLWLSILKVDRTAMRHHSINLGIVGNLYGLFACMITGRPWESVLSGIDKVSHSQKEKDQFQKQLPNVLPQISDVLQKVNRQMLLIFKTNDLLRGIEYTLQTGSNMLSFMTMSKCCINAVHKEEFDKASTKYRKLQVFISRQWLLFKLKVYYSYLSLRRRDFYGLLNVLSS